MTTIAAAYDTMLNRVLNVAGILRARSLASDSPDTDYVATRDKTLHYANGRGEHFSYKDYHRTEQVFGSEGGSGRRTWARYHLWVAGQVVKIGWKFADHPLYGPVSDH
jgi:hypothetical protein